MDIDLDRNNLDDNWMAPKSNQCEYTSSRAGNLKRHLKTHSGEKPNKCNQCDFASSEAGHLGIHLKTHSLERSNATDVIMHPLTQEI